MRCPSCNVRWTGPVLSLTSLKDKVDVICTFCSGGPFTISQRELAMSDVEEKENETKAHDLHPR